MVRISLRNPPLNVIDFPMMDELARTLTEAEGRTDVSILVFAGEGNDFSGGVDIAAHAPDKVEEMLARFHAVIRMLVGTRKVTVAVARGRCLGGGAELALVCDMAFTTDDAEWGFPEVKLGCYPPVAVTALSAVVGQKRAAELILSGRTITGRDAASIGLATRSVPEAELGAVVEGCVASLAQLSPAALAVAKKAMYAWDAVHFDKGLARAEKIYLEELMKTEDAKEGIEAFLQRRKPVWKGR